MERKVVYAGKIKPGISKSENCLEIINEINTYKIKKEMKEMLFLAAMKIIPEDKKNEDIIFHLEAFKKSGKIYPNFSFSNYIQNIINNINSLDEKSFKTYIQKTISYVFKYKVEFREG